MLLFVAVSAFAAGQSVWVKAIVGNYERYKVFLNDTARVMPEEDYAFRLTPVQRPFGEWIEHTAVLVSNACSQIKGVPSAPASETHLKTKAEISKALEDSFAFCDGVLKDMDDAKAAREITIGDRKVIPANMMVGLIATLNEHYGNLVGYMRAKGITPPSTARAQQKKK